MNMNSKGSIFRPALFGIVQGGREESLRKRSAEFIGSLDFDGFGIGGTLGSMHNLYFIINLVKRMRGSILGGNFAEFKKEFLFRYNI